MFDGVINQTSFGRVCQTVNWHPQWNVENSHHPESVGSPLRLKINRFSLFETKTVLVFLTIIKAVSDLDSTTKCPYPFYSSTKPCLSLTRIKVTVSVLDPLITVTVLVFPITDFLKPRHSGNLSGFLFF